MKTNSQLCSEITGWSFRASRRPGEETLTFVPASNKFYWFQPEKQAVLYFISILFTYLTRFLGILNTSSIYCSRPFLPKLGYSYMSHSIYCTRCNKSLSSFSPQVTYVLSGASAHEDFCGHTGKLEPGDLQVDHTLGPDLRSMMSSMDLKHNLVMTVLVCKIEINSLVY